MVLVPAFLMVSTFRFRSIKAIDVGWRRSYFVLFLAAVVLALIATHPRLALVVLAYTYLASAFIGLAYSRLRTRPVGATGRRTLTVVPWPFWLSTSIVPPFNSMLRRAIGRPRPGA